MPRKNNIVDFNLYDQWSWNEGIYEIQIIDKNGILYYGILHDNAYINSL